MKSNKKILALILAGVMALALLTGCGKSLDRTMAEGLAEYYKSEFAADGLSNNISVSYQVPELRREIAPLFDENWITKDRVRDVLNIDYMVNGKSVKDTLTDILSHKSATGISFFIADVTDTKTAFMENIALVNTSVGYTPKECHDFRGTTSMKVAVTHKTVNGRTYALAVLILEK